MASVATQLPLPTTATTTTIDKNEEDEDEDNMPKKEPKKRIVAISARRAAEFERERDRLNAEATDAALADLRQKKKQANGKKRKADQSDDDALLLGAFVRAHAYRLAAYEGQLPRPLPTRDSDDESDTLAREEADELHQTERNFERHRRLAGIRRLRIAYARRALPRLHALRREAFALARLGERARVDAARIVGPDPRERGYRPDVERRGDLQTQDDHEQWRERDADAEVAPGFADLLRAADAHLLKAERLVARGRAAFGGDDDARMLVRPDADEWDYAADRLFGWNDNESDVEDDDETDMSDADEEDEAAKKKADA
jgi:hypothetical protein